MIEEVESHTQNKIPAVAEGYEPVMEFRAELICEIHVFLAQLGTYVLESLLLVFCGLLIFLDCSFCNIFGEECYQFYAFQRLCLRYAVRFESRLYEFFEIDEVTVVEDIPVFNYYLFGIAQIVAEEVVEGIYFSVFDFIYLFYT